jgi:hypothetical protein
LLNWVVQNIDVSKFFVFKKSFKYFECCDFVSSQIEVL